MECNDPSEHKINKRNSNCDLVRVQKKQGGSLNVTHTLKYIYNYYFEIVSNRIKSTRIFYQEHKFEYEYINSSEKVV